MALLPLLTPESAAPAMRTKCAISYAASEIALLRFCGLQTKQKRNDAAMVCLRWHGSGLNSTDGNVLSLLDILRSETSDFHLSPHSNVSFGNLERKATSKSFDRQYIKSI